MVNCKPRKPKLNTKISTEAELVGVGDYLPYNICIYFFMGEQGNDIKQSILFQDTQSAIKKNRKKLCIGKSKNIDIRYLFAKVYGHST